MSSLSSVRLLKFLFDKPLVSSNVRRFAGAPLSKFSAPGPNLMRMRPIFSSTSSSTSKPQETPASTGEKPEETTKENGETNPQIEQLNSQLQELIKQKNELNDKYMRALAETENMRKRLTKQIDDAKIYGIQSFCKDLLDVADVLSKATECVPKEEIKDSNPHLKNLFEGLTMTEAQLHKVFTRHGLTPVNPLNEKFNPNLHEALFQQEVEGKEAGTVVVVSKIGYKLHERVVRPALVGVAKG
ncbi:Hypothetical protein NTJ_14450 [Nesidiocoris tenuis]|uniref:GrpE protein homolog n=1 Tax=Nesidiocoris tenuis TaxID=355587 RepID=A0ABN7BBI6_9HEMI|nr:Hypothetical protein NTJ_14450 [Nesidiocoris tenuis]